MEGSGLIWVMPILVTAVCILSLVIVFLFSFIRYPLESTLKASVGIIALLAASAFGPEFHGSATLSVNLGSFLSIEGQNIIISTSPTAIYYIVILSVTTLSVISLLRLSDNKINNFEERLKALEQRCP